MSILGQSFLVTNKLVKINVGGKSRLFRQRDGETLLEFELRIVAAVEAPKSPVRDTKTIDLLVLVAAGLAEIAAADIDRVLGPVECAQVANPPPADQWAPDGCGSVFPGSAGVTKLRVRLTAPTTPLSWDELRRAVASLKGVQCVMALVGVHSGIPLDALSAMAAIDAAACNSRNGWSRALDTWRHFHPGRSSNSTPTFRASAVRDGQHDYTSMDVAQVGRRSSDVVAQ